MAKHSERAPRPNPITLIYVRRLRPPLLVALFLSPLLLVSSLGPTCYRNNW